MILSFDTSNYTTSIAILDDKKIVLDKRTLIKVKQGERGIRQSDAFFQHIQNLNHFISTDFGSYRDKIDAVAVSTNPRPLADSYMPVFTAGLSIASTIATAMQLPLIKTSHQEGHLYSALSEQTMPAEFLFFHLSGGTTELHLAQADGQLYDLAVVAETADINFGQLIDRIGVAAGLAFPAGQKMDDLRSKGLLDFRWPSFKAQAKFNLSGYENYFKNLLVKDIDKADIYQLLFTVISEIILSVIDFASKKTGVKTVLLAGGVAENSLIRSRLTAVNDFTIKFASNSLARDNAIGVANYAQRKLNC